MDFASRSVSFTQEFVRNVSFKEKKRKNCDLSIVTNFKILMCINCDCTVGLMLIAVATTLSTAPSVVLKSHLEQYFV